MKKFLIVTSLLALAVLPAVSSAQERTKAESAKYLQDLVRSKVKEAAQEQIEDMATRLNPKAVKLYKKVGSVISTAELAASICWDLIQIGLTPKKEQFATQFAMRMRKYLPDEYKIGAEVMNPLAEKWFGHRIPNEADCTTILYELGKNTYDAITRMSGAEKQEAIKAGVSIFTPGALFVDINLGRRYGNILRTGSQGGR